MNNDDEILDLNDDMEEEILYIPDDENNQEESDDDITFIDINSTVPSKNNSFDKISNIKNKIGNIRNNKLNNNITSNNRSKNNIAKAPNLPKLGKNGNLDLNNMKERLARSKSQNFNFMQGNRNNQKGEEQKSAATEVQEKIASKAISAGAQSVGIPKPVADAISKKVAGPAVKALKMQIMIAVIAIVVFILIVILVIAGISSSDSDSENRNEFMYGSGSEESLYAYLIEMGYCEDIETCSSTNAFTFYKKLREVIDSNSNLSDTYVDWFIVELITYGRETDEAFSHYDEIDSIVNIINSHGRFSTSKLDLMKDEIFTSYFDVYRADLFVENSSYQYKQEVYTTIVENTKSLIQTFETDNITDTGTSVCSYDVRGKNVSNIKVRLLQCVDGIRGEPVEGEELIDFEKYILGVTYAENGDAPMEAIKAQSIAARNISLLRGDLMGGKWNLGLKLENGQWILSIRSCTEDHAYCDPDKGCWSNDKYAGETVHSGYVANKPYAKKPLAADSKIRIAVAETAGKVLVDSNGELVETPYKNTEQKKWNNLASAGGSHFEILKDTYGNASSILSVCNVPPQNYQNWKQCGESWSSIRLGNSPSNICKAGCYITSIAIQMAKSGTKINSSSFNPGVLVQTLNANGAFSTNGSLQSFSWSSLAPNFIPHGRITLSGTKAQKAATIQSYASQGYYVIIRAKSNQHWVALDHVYGDQVYIHDPAGKATNLWQAYPNHADITAITVFKNKG